MKRVFITIFLCVATACIDPYSIKVKNYNSLLVVDGLLTNENSSYKVRLLRTTKDESAIPEKVADADVYITDGDGITTNLQNCGDGYYKTDSTSFTGAPGKKYTLHILTGDGKEYRSEECEMLPGAGIDSVYYKKSDEITGTNGKVTSGLKIVLNSEDVTGTNQYFRYTYEETWKFIVPIPKLYNAIIVVDSTTYLFEEVPVVKNICWKKSQSDEILINSVLSAESNHIEGQLIKFIDPVESDRLTSQYSILVKQYSLSEQEYEFWNNLRKVTDAGGDIFSLQPYQVTSNIRNVKDASEKVLGYFEVSSVSRKRIFIAAHELNSLDLPHYQTNCVEIAKSPDDWPDNKKEPSFYEIYFKIMNGYTFIRPVFSSTLTLRKLVFATKECSMCEYSGFDEKPDFWVDMK